MSWLGAATGYHPFVVTAWGSDLLVGAQRSWAQCQLARWVLAHRLVLMPEAALDGETDLGIIGAILDATAVPR